MESRVEKEEYPPPMRAESRRLVQGGREEPGKIPLEQAAQRPLAQ